MKLAILICHLPERKDYLDRLIGKLLSQMNQLRLAGGVIEDGDTTYLDDVGIFINDSPRPKTTGAKRNELVAEAVKCGYQYASFIDDDDLIGDTYLQRGMETVASGKDCAELWGQIYFSGKKGKPFHHSIIHKEWWEDQSFYYRTINHLNFQRLDLIKDYPFMEKNFGEDGDQAMAMHHAGIFKTMHKIEDVLYHYYVGEPKHEVK